jgi:hypothetical protein
MEDSKVETKAVIDPALDLKYALQDLQIDPSSPDFNEE